MTKIEQTCRAFYIAAKPTATLVSVCLFLPVFSMLCDCCKGNTYELAYSMGLLSFFGYAVFIMLPINRLDGFAFLLLFVIGSFLCIASIPQTVLAYRLFIGLCEAENVYHEFVYHLCAWILLIPVYAHLPILLLIKIRYSQCQA